MRSFSFLLGWSLVAGATCVVAAEPNDALRVAYNSTPQYTAYESLVLGAGVLRKENAEK